MHSTSKKSTPEYCNPVFSGSSPDPFVLKYQNEYWCYCTGFAENGRCFEILTSRDLIRWTRVGGAMDKLNSTATCYWAPEVFPDNGRFLLYYSVGDGETMHIRVAEGLNPRGPFVDAGVTLTTEEFAIDPHVFEEEDGTRYLFYATDFLTHTHIGTGTVCDKMLDPFTLAGTPRPVTRARFDWQVFDPNRREKGGVRWHTVEGPFVLKHKGTYYEMFSAGNWKNQSYGVSYATADSLSRSDEWEQAADGKNVLPILRTVEGKVTGPGHNSVVRGPDNRQLFCVYHRLEGENRLMAVDRLEWVGERMSVLGPTYEPQPTPIAPAFSDFFDKEVNCGLGTGWQCDGGDWCVRGGEAFQRLTQGMARATCLVQAANFTAEVNLRAISNENGDLGLQINGTEGALARVQVIAALRQLQVSWRTGSENEAWSTETIQLPRSFDPLVYHLVRIDVNGRRILLGVDQNSAKWERTVAARAQSISLFSQGPAAFSGFALTTGWEDQFYNPASLAELGWENLDNGASWEIAGKRLRCGPPPSQESIIVKGDLLESYEYVVNARLDNELPAGGSYGFLPEVSGDGSNPLIFKLVRAGKSWALRIDGEAGMHSFFLDNFDPYVYQQFRFRKEPGRVVVRREGTMLGTVATKPSSSRVGLYASDGAASFDLVRLTGIS